jgi:RimJ/RimL family protein N-acetyltransferase
MPCAPAVEVGWRLARGHWGRGHATEAARRALRHGFEALGLEEIVSFTTLANARSRAVMVRIGLREDPGRAFEHPKVPIGHPVRPHCLYCVSRQEWNALQ